MDSPSRPPGAGLPMTFFHPSAGLVDAWLTAATPLEVEESEEPTSPPQAPKGFAVVVRRGLGSSPGERLAEELRLQLWR